MLSKDQAAQAVHSAPLWKRRTAVILGAVPFLTFTVLARLWKEIKEFGAAMYYGLRSDLSEDIDDVREVWGPDKS